MDCGPGVPLCGVLTLETGRGGGAYQHSAPVVHGLWPQVGNYGTSKCMAPKDAQAPTQIFQCYDQEGTPHTKDLGFEKHEWITHGRCAGAKDAEDFFGQVCTLSSGPLHVMEGARSADLDLVDTADALQRGGFCVWAYGSSQQVELSACAGPDGRWKLADYANFAQVCGGGGGDTPAVTPQGAKCLPSQRGPACKHDSDCAAFGGCLRCARSGFCTDVPLGRALLLDALPAQAHSAVAAQAPEPANAERLRLVAAAALIFVVALAARALAGAALWGAKGFDERPLHQPLARQSPVRII